MKIQKKLLAVLVVCVLLMTSMFVMSVSASFSVSTEYAESQFEVKMVMDKDVKTGEFVTADIYVTGKSIKVMSILPSYDDTVLQPIMGSWTLDASTMFQYYDPAAGETVFQTLDGLALKTAWGISGNDMAAATFAVPVDFENEKVFRLIFKVIATEFDPGSSTLISFEDLQIKAKDINDVASSEIEYKFNDPATSEAFEVSGGEVHAFCEHNSTNNVAAQAPTCYQVGYTAGVQCDACQRFTSGHEEVPATGNHSYSSWDHDQSNHWKKCGTDGCVAIDEASKVAHTFDYDCDTDCNDDCGYERTVDHQFDEYLYDDDNHWLECSKTGCTVVKEGTKVAHTFDPNNECDTDCEDANCAYVRTVDHQFDEYLYDDDNHWLECSKTGCTVVKEGTKVAHTYAPNNECDTDCEDANCAYVRTVDHQFDEYLHDDDNHWLECSKTGCTVVKEGTKNLHLFDSYACDADCNDENCNYTRQTSHDFTKVEKDETYHWYVCSYGCGTIDESSKVEHTYASVCDDTCSLVGCGNVRSDAPHNLNGVDYSYDDIATGEHWKVCADCGDKLEVGTHVWEGGIDSCDEDCNVCGYNRGPGAHNFVDGWTYDTDYHYSKKCDKCGKADESTKAAHTAKAEYTYDGTSHWNKCEQDGCEAKLNEVAHTWDTDYSKDGDNHWFVCTAGCGAKKDVEAHAGQTVCDNICAKCGEAIEPQHPWETDLRHDADNHYYKCSLCDEKKDVTAHTWSTDYSKDETNHWFVCTANCGAKKDEATHDWEHACDTLCDTCGQTRTVEHPWETALSSDADNHYYKCSTVGCTEKKDVTAHTWSTEYSKDENNHWIECEDCGYIDGGKAPHDVWSSNCDTTCNTCGYTRTVTTAHANKVLVDDGTGIMVDKFESDVTGHWNICSDCGEKVDAEAHDYPVADGCNAVCECGSVKGHDYSVVKSDKDGHWYKCSNCDVEDTAKKEAHTPDRPAATTTAAKTCTECGYVIAPRVVVKNTHKHNLVLVEGKAATCTEAGTDSYYKCSGCGKMFKGADASNRIYDIDSVSNKAKGHTEVVVPAVAATCTTAGKTEGKSCSACGAVIVAQEDIPAFGHTFGEWAVVTEATATADGEKARECSECGEKETEVIPATGEDETVEPTTPDDTQEPDDSKEPEVTDKPDTPSTPVTPPVTPNEPKDDGVNVGLVVGVVAAVAVLGGGVTAAVVFINKGKKI